MSVSAILNKKDSPIEEDAIMHLSKTGTHVLASGRTATVVTDERLLAGDRVLVIADAKGKLFILGGSK